MRLLHQPDLTLAAGASTTVDVFAAGARSALISVNTVAGALSTNRVQIHDGIGTSNPVLQDQADLIAAMWPFSGGSSAIRFNWVFTPIYNGTLFINNTGATSSDFRIQLFDEPPPLSHGYYVAQRQETTIAAAGTFTSTTFNVGRFPNTCLMLKSDRICTVRVDLSLTGIAADLYLNVKLLTMAVGGDTVFFAFTCPTPRFRIFVTNTDGANPALVNYFITQSGPATVPLLNP